MAYTVSTDIVDLIEPTDASGTLISGIASTLQSNLFTRKPGGTTFTATIAEIGSTGRYTITFTPDTTGDWYWSTSYSTPLQRFYETYSVISAAADPAALATAIAAVQTTVDTIDGNVDVAVSTRATIGELISENLTVDAPSATESDKTIIVGDAATLPWSSTGWPDLTAKTATFQAYKMITNAAVFASAKTVTISNAGAATQNLAITLAGTDTDDFVPGVLYRYEVNSTAGLLVSGSLAAREG